MGRNPARLNQKQVEVLRWVVDGCPLGGDEEGFQRRITARALERRGLIAVKGHGAAWSASITKVGLAWLAARPGVPPTDAEVDELICRVQAGDRRLVLPDNREVEMAHEQLVKMSEHSASRPSGWRLEMRATGPWADRRKEIILVRQESGGSPVKPKESGEQTGVESGELRMSKPPRRGRRSSSEPHDLVV